MRGVTWIVVVLSALALFVVLLDVTATIALVRSQDLSRLRKVAQLAVVWLVPIIGAHLVVRFLYESEPRAIPDRWVPNDAINVVLLGALGVTVREVVNLAESAVEQQVIHAVSGHFSSGEGTAVNDLGSAGHNGGH
jgi:tellurite resistance protein TehA-like permease